MIPAARRPTFKQLSYFLALEAQEHFGRAAEACSVSPSAFSVAIQELENQLGVQLIDRSRRQIAITRLGREVAAQARLVLRDLDQLTDLADANHKPLSGRLTLGVIPTIAPFLLPRWLPELKRAYPALKLYFREGQTQLLLEQLASGELDLVLLALPYATRQLQVMPLFEDRFLLACHADTTLVDPQNFSLNRVTAESVLLLEDGHCLRDHALAACGVQDLESINRFSASSLFTLLGMVDEDLGITFLPEMAIDSALLSQTSIKTYPMKREARREIALVWRKASARSDEFTELGQHLIDNAAGDCEP
jgi:LysR family hydrogen peroxide-inducible transcriptional activator